MQQDCPFHEPVDSHLDDNRIHRAKDLSGAPKDLGWYIRAFDIDLQQ
jgi:hypothetical protein